MPHGCYIGEGDAAVESQWQHCPWGFLCKQPLRVSTRLVRLQQPFSSLRCDQESTPPFHIDRRVLCSTQHFGLKRIKINPKCKQDNFFSWGLRSLRAHIEEDRLLNLKNVARYYTICFNNNCHSSDARKRIKLQFIYPRKLFHVYFFTFRPAHSAEPARKLLTNIDLATIAEKTLMVAWNDAQD